MVAVVVTAYVKVAVVKSLGSAIVKVVLVVVVLEVLLAVVVTAFARVGVVIVVGAL